jgi:hypothetical protein
MKKYILLFLLSYVQTIDLDKLQNNKIISADQIAERAEHLDKETEDTKLTKDDVQMLKNIKLHMDTIDNNISK